jgi:ketosteroid isomerase-like protein
MNIFVFGKRGQRTEVFAEYWDALHISFFMKQILVVFLWLCTLEANAQSADHLAIRRIMAEQEAAWSRGDLEGFMAGYWKSDSLRFIGSSGLTYGWQKTLDNYKKGYPSLDAMGKLTFTIISIEKLSKRSAFVIGKWHLARKAGELNGYYTLLWRKIKGNWVIVVDHSN